MPEKERIPAWQKGLQLFQWPFEKIHKYAIEPFAATVTAPFTPQAPGYQGEGLPWLGRQIAEYRAAQLPSVQLGNARYPSFMGGGPITLGVKGALETLPWLALPGVGTVGRAGAAAGGVGRTLARGTLLGGRLAAEQPWGIAGALGQAGKVGRAVGKAVEYSPWGLTEKAAMLPFKGASALARGAGKKGAKLTDAEILEQAAKGAAPESGLMEGVKPLGAGDIASGWQQTYRGRMVYKADIALENANESLAYNKITSAPSYPKLLAAYKRFQRSLYGAEDPYAVKSIQEAEREPWKLLTAHAGVMNAKSGTAKTLRNLADAVFSETKLPRKPEGKFRGESGLDWDAIKVKPSEAAPPVTKGAVPSGITPDISPTMPESYVQARKRPDGKWQLFFIGTRNEVFPNELFASASEAKMAFRVAKAKGAEAIPPTGKVVAEKGVASAAKREITPVTRDQSYGTQLMDKIKIWDARGEPDSTYKQLTYGGAGRRTDTLLKKGETWRGRAVDLAQADLQRRPVIEAPAPKVEQGAVTPAAPAAEGAAGGRPPRRPLWAGFEEPPQKPPEGPTPTPTAFPSGRVPGGIGRQTPYVAPDSYSQLQEALAAKKQPLGDKVSAGLNKVLPEMYDRNYLLKEIERVTGLPVHKAAQAVSGAVAAAEDNIRRSIQPILRSVGADTPLLEEYLVLQRLTDVTAKNPTALLPRNMRGMEAVIEAQKKLAAKLGPERFAAIEAAAKQYWKETSELTLELLRKEGMIDDATYLRLKTSSPHYIPLNRADFSEIDGVTRYMGVQEASVSTTGMKRMGELGSVRDLDNPLARGIQQIIRVRQAVARKQTATMLLQGLQEYEKLTGQKMVRFLPPGQKAEHSALTDTISTFIEGKKVIAQVPREYAVIAKGLEAEVAGMWGKLLSVTAAPLRYGATTYNPAFLVVNPMRDALTAFFREGVIPFSPDYIKGWISAIYKDATFTEAAQAGELMSGLVERMRSTSAVARQASVGSLPLKNWKDALLFVPRLIEWGNVTGERATRLATHIKLTREGVTGLERTVRVRDSTVDFSKMGNSMKVINQAIPFFNAGIQGAFNVGRTIRDKPGWALKASTPFAAISIMTWLNNKRFDSSDKIPSFEYYNNWVLQVGEGREKVDPNDPYKEPETFPIYLKIPKGPIGASLTAAPELLLRLAWGMNNRSVIDEVLAGARGFSSSLLPIEPNLGGILPPALSTAVQLQTGQDIYRGLPIVPEREKRLPPEQQFGADVSTAAVQLGQTFKVSPRLIDFAIKDYAAGTGSTLTWLSSMALEALGAKPEPYGAAFITERSSEQSLAKTPVVSRFVGVRGNAMETAQRKELVRLVKDAQQTFRRFPDVNRLGITFSEVGDTIMDVPLEMPERIEYQRLTNQLALTGLAALFDSTGYQSLSPAQKKELILKTMSLARDAARQSLVPKLNEMVQIRYELGQHGASLSRLEALSGEKWNSPANLETLKDALSVLRPYWNLEATTWGQYPAEYKQVYDQWRTINKIDAREAKRFLFKYPQVAMAIRRVALAKKQMLLQLEPKLSTARELLFS